jgi:hypothetical protein
MSYSREDINLLLRTWIQWPHRFGNFLGYDLLTEIHSEWIKYAWLSPVNASLQAHRNSYKTTAILVVGAIWYLLIYDPNATILFLRRSADDALSIVKEIKQHYETPKLRNLYHLIYATTTNKGNTWRDGALSLITKKKISKEPNVDHLGMTSNITGDHYDKVFADDIITIKDRTSKAERESTKTFLKELINIPKIDGGTIFFTGTPWHKDDAWQKIPEPKKFPLGSIDIKGLTKEKVLHYKKTLGASLYSANYELKHVADEDQLFKEPKYGEWPERFKRISAWIDPSYEGKNTTSMAMIGITVDSRVFVRGWTWDEHIIKRYGDIVKVLEKYNCGSYYVETNADQGYSKKDLSEMRPGCIGRRSHKNKHVKIISFALNNWDDLIFAEDCQGEFVNQIMDYQEGQEPDDAPDALASLIEEMKIGKKSILERF